MLIMLGSHPKTTSDFSLGKGGPNYKVILGQVLGQAAGGLVMFLLRVAATWFVSVYTTKKG